MQVVVNVQNRVETLGDETSSVEEHTVPEMVSLVDLRKIWRSERLLLKNTGGI